MIKLLTSHDQTSHDCFSSFLENHAELIVRPSARRKPPNTSKHLTVSAVDTHRSPIIITQPTEVYRFYWLPPPLKLFTGHPLSLRPGERINVRLHPSPPQTPPPPLLTSVFQSLSLCEALPGRWIYRSVNVTLLCTCWSGLARPRSATGTRASACTRYRPRFLS